MKDNGRGPGNTGEHTGLTSEPGSHDNDGHTPKSVSSWKIRLDSWGYRLARLAAGLGQGTAAAVLAALGPLVFLVIFVPSYAFLNTRGDFSMGGAELLLVGLAPLSLPGLMALGMLHRFRPIPALVRGGAWAAPFLGGVALTILLTASYSDDPIEMVLGVITVLGWHLAWGLASAPFLFPVTGSTHLRTGGAVLYFAGAAAMLVTLLFVLTFPMQDSYDPYGVRAVEHMAILVGFAAASLVTVILLVFGGLAMLQDGFAKRNQPAAPATGTELTTLVDNAFASAAITEAERRRFSQSAQAATTQYPSLVQDRWRARAMGSFSLLLVAVGFLLLLLCIPGLIMLAATDIPSCTGVGLASLSDCEDDRSRAAEAVLMALGALTAATAALGAPFVATGLLGFGLVGAVEATAERRLGEVSRSLAAVKEELLKRLHEHAAAQRMTGAKGGVHDASPNPSGVE